MRSRSQGSSLQSTATELQSTSDASDAITSDTPNR